VPPAGTGPAPSAQTVLVEPVRCDRRCGQLFVDAAGVEGDQSFGGQSGTDRLDRRGGLVIDRVADERDDVGSKEEPLGVLQRDEVVLPDRRVSGVDDREIDLTVPQRLDGQGPPPSSIGVKSTSSP